MKNIENLASNTARFITRNPNFCISSSIVLFIVLTLGIFKINSNFSVKIWLQENDPRITALNEHEHTFGSSDSIDLVITNKKGIFNHETLKAVSELTEKMWTVTDIVRVESLVNHNWVTAEGDDINISPFISTDLDETQEELNIKRDLAIFDKQLLNNFISSSGNMTYIRSILKTTNGTPPYEKIVLEVEDIVKNYQTEDLHISLSGITFINESLQRASNRDMGVVFPIVFLLLVVILYAFFKNLAGIVLPFVIIILTIAATFGVEGFIGLDFNNILSAVPAILIAIGLADSIHILISYRHFLIYEKLSNEQAAYMCLKKNFVATILTTVTTAIGFFSLTSTFIRPVHDLGLLAGIGCLIAWLLTYFLLGASLKFFNFHGSKSSEKEDLNLLHKVFLFSIKYRKIVIITFPLIAIIMGYIGSKNLINADPVEYFSNNTPIKKTIGIVQEEFGASRSIELVFDGGAENMIKNAEFLKKSEAFINWLETQPKIVRVVSFVDVIRKMNQTLHGDKKEYYKIPDTDGEVNDQFFLYTLGLPSGLDLKNQISIDNSKFRAMILWDVKDTMNAIIMTDIILAKAAEFGLKVYEGGQSPIYNRVNDLVVDTFFYSMSLTLPLIFFIMFITFKDFKIALLSLIPNIFPLAIAAGIMTLNNDHINIGNVIVFAVCLGIAVDDTIHFVANYKINILQGMDSFDAISDTIKKTGKALILTTVLLFFGFGMFILGDFVPNQKFGIYCSIILLLALLADLVLLPALLMTISPPRNEKS